MATEYRLYIYSKTNKEPLHEDYPTKADAQAALAQFVADANVAGIRDIITSVGGSIAIRSTDFQSARVGEIQTGSGKYATFGSTKNEPRVLAILIFRSQDESADTGRIVSRDSESG